MPSGKTHLRLNGTLLLLWGGLCVLLLRRDWVLIPHTLIFGGCYAFSMMLMSPDLDLARSNAFRRWGHMQWIWYPYAWIFRHRQTSHHLLVGPLTRILYLAVLTLAGTGMYVWITGHPWPRALLSTEGALAILLGLYLPNLQHIAADRLSTTWRRKRRRHRL